MNRALDDMSEREFAFGDAIMRGLAAVNTGDREKLAASLRETAGALYGSYRTRADHLSDLDGLLLMTLYAVDDWIRGRGRPVRNVRPYACKAVLSAILAAAEDPNDPRFYDFGPGRPPAPLINSDGTATP